MTLFFECLLPLLQFGDMHAYSKKSSHHGDSGRSTRCVVLGMDVEGSCDWPISVKCTSLSRGRGVVLMTLGLRRSDNYLVQHELKFRSDGLETSRQLVVWSAEARRAWCSCDKMFCYAFDVCRSAWRATESWEFFQRLMIYRVSFDSSDRWLFVALFDLRWERSCTID